MLKRLRKILLRQDNLQWRYMQVDQLLGQQYVLSIIF